MNNNCASLGLFVDIPYIADHGGIGMRFDTLRELVRAVGGGELQFMNAYSALPLNPSTDPYRSGSNTDAVTTKHALFLAALRDLGYRVYCANSDDAHYPASVIPYMSVDLVTQSHRVNQVWIVSGDPNLVHACEMLQRNGVSVCVIGLNHVSPSLRNSANFYLSGYLIPDLIPIRDRQRRSEDEDESDKGDKTARLAQPNQESPAAWGEAGSRVRGVCHYFNDLKGYGYMRFLTRIPQGPAELYRYDSRLPLSPYKTAFFHRSFFSDGHPPVTLPSRDVIFEFDLTESDRGPGLQASHIVPCTD